MDPKGWNISKIREWLSSPLTQEDNNFELKAIIPDNDAGKYRLKKEFCGFANQSGGYMFFGIKDDKTIIGMNEKQFTTKISQILTKHIYPPTIKWKLYECIPLENQEKYIYVAKIFESFFWKKPHVLYTPDKKGLCIPLREQGHLRNVTDGAEIRRIFLNIHGYYPEYNIHVVEILKKIKSKNNPDFSLNERIIIQAFKMYLTANPSKYNIRMIDQIEEIEKIVFDNKRSLSNGIADGQVIGTSPINQKLEQMVDNYISEFGKQFYE